MRDYFDLHKTEIYLESKVRKIHNNSIFIVDKQGNEKEIKVDSIISSIGYNPHPLDTNNLKKTYLVGDCLKIGNLRTVIWNAWDVAMKL